MKTIDYNKPHMFEASGKMHISGVSECVCGLSAVSPIHPIELKNISKAPIPPNQWGTILANIDQITRNTLEIKDKLNKLNKHLGI